MSTLSRSPVPLDPAEVASTMRLLAEATDRRSFFATLREALPRLLPAIRVDVLANDADSEDYLLLSGGAPAALPPDKRTGAGFAEWLGGQGYGVVATLPLTGAGQHLGWLLLSRRGAPFHPDVVALGGQLAALTALRLLYDQCRADLADRDSHSALLEQRLREGEAVYQHAVMAAGAAHDIGNLFASVVGYVELLEQNAPATLHADLQAIARVATDGQQLIRRILSLNAPRSAAAPVPVALLPTVIRDALKLTRPFWEAKPGMVVKTMLAPVLPVRGNAVELREVLINLIMNAIAAMPDGGVLTVRCFVAGDHVLVAVTDTGEGIAREYHNAIFQPLMTTRKDGSGLGLSVSRAIVENYGGTLTVESELGAGATFTLAMPAVRSLDTLHDTQTQAWHPCEAL